MLVHYYQPYHTTVESETTVSSVETGRGKTSFKYCPNTSGCRTVVKRLGGGDTFRLGNRVAVNFKLPKDNQLWVVSIRSIMSKVSLIYYLALFYWIYILLPELEAML